MSVYVRVLMDYRCGGMGVECQGDGYVNGGAGASCRCVDADGASGEVEGLCIDVCMLCG